MTETKTFWLRDERNNPVALVGTQVFDQSQPNTLAFAVVTYNPLDRFDRRFAHKKLKERLSVSSRTVNRQVGNVKAQILRQILYADYVAGKYVFPRRTRDAAHLWLKSHTPAFLAKDELPAA